MILPTMNSEELVREILKDYPVVMRKVFYAMVDLRRPAIKSKNKHVKKIQVFAEWFSGEIRVPMGEMLEYVHMDYYSVYEKDLFITMENGIVIGQTTKSNINEPDEQ